VTPDERLRAAQAALAEREHLAHVKAELAPQLQAEDQRVQQRTHALRREQADVDRLGSGVLGFLNELLGGQLSREQREVAEAAARLREAIAARDVVRDQLASTDARLAELANADVELAAARAAKEAELVRTGSPLVAELDELDIQAMAIDIELVPLHEALVAGHAALAALAAVVLGLDVLEGGGRKQASGLIGDADGKLRVFEAELADLAGLPLELPQGAPGDADLAAWVDALLGRGDRDARLAAAREDLAARIARLRTRLEPIRARHDELAGRRAALVTRRAELIEGAR
jgi:hypothetical protein